MPFLLSLSMPFLVATLLAAICTLAWRRQLARPPLFFLLSFVIVLGVHRLVQAIFTLARLLWPDGGGHFVEHRGSDSTLDALGRQLTLEALLIALVSAAASYAMLLALRARAWSSPSPSGRGSG